MVEEGVQPHTSRHPISIHLWGSGAEGTRTNQDRTWRPQGEGAVEKRGLSDMQWKGELVEGTGLGVTRRLLCIHSRVGGGI